MRQNHSICRRELSGISVMIGSAVFADLPSLTRQGRFSYARHTFCVCITYSRWVYRINLEFSSNKKSVSYIWVY